MTTSDHIALVVPPVTTAPTRRATFRITTDPRLLDVLRREIQPPSETVDSSPLVRTPIGPFMYWTDDTALYNNDLEHNDRVIALCRAFGYDVPDVRGTIALTGDISAAGDCLGLTPTLLGYIEEGFAAAAADSAKQGG